MSDTPRTDREVYRITPENLKSNTGFEVVNPGLCRDLERELAASRAVPSQFPVDDLPPATDALMAEWMSEIPGGPEGWNGLTTDDLKQFYASLRTAFVTIQPGADSGKPRKRSASEARAARCASNEESAACSRCEKLTGVIRSLSRLATIDRQIVSRAAEDANRDFGQWMPDAWLRLFEDHYDEWVRSESAAAAKETPVVSSKAEPDPLGEALNSGDGSYKP